MKKILITIFVLSLFILSAPKASAAIPLEACLNLAAKVDERVQKVVSSIPYPSPSNQLNPCNDNNFEPADHYYDPSWSGRYKRYIFADGTIMGRIYQGYMGGKVTEYAICPDGRAKVTGKSFGYYGMGADQNVCNTF